MTPHEMDSVRLDRLSAPGFVFHYSITPGGSVRLCQPEDAVCANLREAIDYARACHKEIPFCPVCPTLYANGRRPITEEHKGEDGRFTCSRCNTTFAFLENTAIATGQPLSKVRQVHALQVNALQAQT